MSIMEGILRGMISVSQEAVTPEEAAQAEIDGDAVIAAARQTGHEIEEVIMLGPASAPVRAFSLRTGRGADLHVWVIECRGRGVILRPSVLKEEGEVLATVAETFALLERHLAEHAAAGGWSKVRATELRVEAETAVVRLRSLLQSAAADLGGEVGPVWPLNADGQASGCIRFSSGHVSVRTGDWYAICSGVNWVGDNPALEALGKKVGAHVRAQLGLNY